MSYSTIGLHGLLLGLMENTFFFRKLECILYKKMMIFIVIMCQLPAQTPSKFRHVVLQCVFKQCSASALETGIECYQLLMMFPSIRNFIVN
jgi:hypothetical protein